ncbi:hypothetical protein HanXRQr2_Chr07g0299461 [Helianthus annuus]|uniref:Uncharacterized protein n=1 Tax=Helianthus annuus TaxID=4232 RepID=A0A9K3ILX5_HELAN|nr:hypothetical protein HanXRQr2_Chr07g0299461 [Helianthus annuus]KAJ0905085.1 hypothetical protein HanPSC8_Chr07g0289941 [Helianthus annuus]
MQKFLVNRERTSNHAWILACFTSSDVGSSFMVLVNLSWAILPKVPHISTSVLIVTVVVVYFVFSTTILTLISTFLPAVTFLLVVSHPATVITLSIFACPDMMAQAFFALR